MTTEYFLEEQASLQMQEESWTIKIKAGVHSGFWVKLLGMHHFWLFLAGHCWGRDLISSSFSIFTYKLGIWKSPYQRLLVGFDKRTGSTLELTTATILCSHQAQFRACHRVKSDHWHPWGVDILVLFTHLPWLLSPPMLPPENSSPPYELHSGIS